MFRVGQIVFCLGFSTLATLVTWAQQERKLIYQVEPQKPAILMDKQIGGMVKIVAIVSPSGTVKRTEVIGGNPILVTAAQVAVKQWKYSPAAIETREVISFRFDTTDRH